MTAPDIEVTSGGEVIVAWTQSVRRAAPPLRGVNDIRVAIRDRRGRWTAPRRVGQTLHFVAADVRLAADARGDAAVIWRGQRRVRAARPHDVLRASVRRAGGRFGAAVSLGEAGTDGQVALGADGRVYAAWTRTLPPTHLRSEIRFATADRLGNWSDPTTVYRDHAGGPKLVPAPDGSVVLAWRAEEEGLGATRTGIVAASVRSPAGAWTPSRVLSEVRTDALQLAGDAAGGTLATWSPAPTSTGTVPRVLYAAQRTPGGDFGPPAATDGVLGGPLAVLDDGTAVVVAAERGVEASVRPPGGTFAALPRRVSSSGEFAVLAGAGKMATTVWLERRRLRTATFTAG